MPELPEVEAARRLADMHCIGRSIVEVLAAEDLKVFVGKTAEEVVAALQGRTVAATKRKGKYFWFELTGPGPQILFHFGMTGYLSVKDKGSAKYVRIADDAAWPPRFTKLELAFDDGTRMAFADARRFAKIKLQDKPEQEDPVVRLGPDAFLEMPSFSDFLDLMARQRRSLKAVLLDQAVLSGIGNWVADEVLYQAKLFPEQPMNELEEGELRALYDAIKQVLDVSIAVDSDAEQLPRDWLFHYRWTGKTATKDFHGNKVDFITCGGRTTAFAPALQKKPSGRPGPTAIGASIQKVPPKPRAKKVAAGTAGEGAGNGRSASKKIADAADGVGDVGKCKDGGMESGSAGAARRGRPKKAAAGAAEAAEEGDAEGGAVKQATGRSKKVDAGRSKRAAGTSDAADAAAQPKRRQRRTAAKGPIVALEAPTGAVEDVDAPNAELKALSGATDKAGGKKAVPARRNGKKRAAVGPAEEADEEVPKRVKASQRGGRAGRQERGAGSAKAGTGKEKKPSLTPTRATRSSRVAGK